MARCFEMLPKTEDRSQPLLKMSTSTSTLPFPLTVQQLYAKALWDPTPTTTTKKEKQLAYALGYPIGWRVERLVEMEKDTGRSIIRDRIHAIGGKKQKSKYSWFHHEAAQKAAAVWEENNGNIDSSHLLPAVPMYTKGDVVQVHWEGTWYAASVTKRKKQGDEFVYSVQYHEEDATQDEVEEENIKPGEDPTQLATDLGFPAAWQATRKGARYIIFAPTGEQFSSKKAALKFLAKAESAALGEKDEGDPPFRKEGHDWIGRQIEWTTEHQVSATRKVKVNQIGTVVGYIASTDLDSQGNPGFIGADGSPANLFNVSFPDQPNHPYASYLLNIQDLEEYEIRDVLLEETESQKRKREEALAPKSTEKKSPKKRRRKRY